MNAMHQFAMSKFATSQSRDDAMLEEIDMLQGKVKDLSAVLNHHKTLKAENARLKAEIEEWQKSVCEQGEVIEGLKAELASWKSVFGHLGTADECGNEWIALQDKLAAAQKDAFRAGMLAAAEEAHKPNEYGFHRTCEEIYEAIREAAKS